MASGLSYCNEHDVEIAFNAGEYCPLCDYNCSSCESLRDENDDLRSKIEELKEELASYKRDDE